ncbi:UvrD-helicase domain-containing protein [Cypionkella sp.]|uniref:UvrD-helicase domain-containing protein n=1 Tax=Cypionkella sp. TaxID=2811411 RepID=UPI002725E988|nr:UvrD-helicase domain-containing protein [Cypionkella sp.]MDO8984348.1 UvrD-helicase domain-containing protein [Cypionkella sp.]MDP2048022.1 UvrD-helicase domain-containing protein [Cypionkella sp.]
MIEWLALGAVALLSNMFGSETKKSAGPSGGSILSRFNEDEWKRKREAGVVAWRESWEKEIDRSRWIPQSTAHRIVEAYPHPNSESGLISLNLKPSILRDLLAEFATHNLEHLAGQKTKLKSFFDTVEASSLTEEQTDACICMDDAVQIVAAAGSGKTSTMVAKTGYVLHEGLAKPEEILLLAFNSKAAEELRQRVHGRLSGFEGLDKVTVSTFHAFGHNQVLGKTRDVARWVGSPTQEKEMIAAIVQDLRMRDPTFGNEWDLFRTVYGRAVDQLRDMVQPRDDGRGNIRTANGEWVKSQEERLIADWLFFHGVRYQYERDYEHPTRTQDHQQYRPDFYYPDAKLYHEHFALDRNGKAPPHFSGDYIAGVRWKRQCHAEYETDLFETTSDSLRNGKGFEQLANVLREHDVELVFDAERPTKGQPPLSTLELAGLVRAFQQHMKSGGIATDDIAKALKSDSASDAHVSRASRFLSLYDRIAKEWEHRLQEANCIDFDDMLSLADCGEIGRRRSGLSSAFRTPRNRDRAGRVDG